MIAPEVKDLKRKHHAKNYIRRKESYAGMSGSSVSGGKKIGAVKRSKGGMTGKTVNGGENSRQSRRAKDVFSILRNIESSTMPACLKELSKKESGASRRTAANAGKMQLKPKPPNDKRGKGRQVGVSGKF